jgi:DNA primase large subunit
VSDLWRYPFLPDARKAVQGLELETLLDDPLYGEARALAIERLNAAISDSLDELGVPVDARDEETYLLSFLFSRLILSAQADSKVINWVALTEALRAEATLNLETTAVLMHVSKQLGVPVKLVGKSFQVDYTVYLTATKNLRTGRWKLVNRGVVDGKVMLDQRTLVRVLREIVVEHLQSLPELPEGLGRKVLERFSPDMKVMQEMAKERQERSLRELGRLDFGKAPPCFNGHLIDLQAGVNLPHPARFFLTTFLTSLGQEPDGIMELYATAPDFKESVTRYQVEHITGKISNAEYDTPSCSSLISQGVCPGGNALCRQIVHPLSYYRVMAEREKPDDVRRERLALVAGSGNAKFWAQLPLDAPDDVPPRSLAAALDADGPSRVTAHVEHFRGIGTKVDGKYIRWASARLVDSTVKRSLETLPLLQWEWTLPLAHAKERGEAVEVTLLPVKLGEQRRLHVLAAG